MNKNIYNIAEKPKIQKPVYIQSNTRKSYPNRFLVEVIELVKKYKSPTESTRGFIENAIIKELQKRGCDFKEPLSKPDLDFWKEDVENL